MKKNGIVALIIYILGVVAGISLAIWAYIDLQALENLPEPGWAAVGAAIIVALGVVVAITFAVPFILKVIQLLTGFKLFGILCVLADIAILVTFICSVVLDNGFTLLIFAIPSLLALISNLRSLSN